MQFDKSMFFVGNEHRGSLSDGSWLSILGKKKGGLPLLEVLMINCDIIIDKPESTIIISIAYIVIIITKMAIILPTGQWYAPSAVINDAW